MTRGELERENVELKRDLARYANAHIILMVERESMQSRLDVLEREKQQCNRDEEIAPMNQDSTVCAESDARVVNNVVRHEYRVLSDAEKLQMQQIKDAGRAFLTLLDGVGQSREISLAKTKVEEAVMWSVKHVTR